MIFKNFNYFEERRIIKIAYSWLLFQCIYVVLDLQGLDWIGLSFATGVLKADPKILNIRGILIPVNYGLWVYPPP